METQTTEAAQAATEPTGPDVNHPDRVTLEKLKVLHDYLIVRPLAVPSRKAGGLIDMPEIAGERERSHRGVVLGVGPGDWNEAGTALVPMTVEEGDLVFFGKYAGTEEEIGGHTVLVMREAELRFCVPAARFLVVEHDNPKFDHLVEDWCDVCHGVPLEVAAKERLELERVQQQQQRVATCECGHVGERHAHLTGPCQECSCMGFAAPGAPKSEAPADRPLEFGTTAADDGLIRKLAAQLHVEPHAISTVGRSRGCVEPDCFFMQTHVTGLGFAPAWVGARCGHVHAAIVLG